MKSDAELRQLEIARRKALWTLANIPPGDQRALQALDILDEIDQRGRIEPESIEQPLSIEEAQKAVSIEPHPIGRKIVREASIPQPWRERFLCASVGSTRVPEGAYAEDWNRFRAEWQNEMRLLEKHRAARNEQK